ncbi:hypothetical protein T492DRAFT_1045588 [Pavlovales sp. CCMP2436]|nr:hypothetical protein T492DRAFT_1045588 [Pavlovales sp. CCMP2436]
MDIEATGRQPVEIEVTGRRPIDIASSREAVVDIEASAVEPAMEPVQSATLGEGRTGAGEEEQQCYVCMEDERDPPLSNVCGCTSSVVHAGCLEKIANCKSARDKPITERTTCAVCARQYNVHFVPFVLSRTQPTRFQTFARTPLGTVAVPIMSVCASIMFIGLLIFLLGRYLALILMISIVVVIWPLCAIRSMRARRSNPINLDDSAFFEKVVPRAHKEVERGNHTTMEQAASMPSSSIVLVVRPARCGHTSLRLPVAVVTAAAMHLAEPAAPAAAAVPSAGPSAGPTAGTILDNVLKPDEPACSASGEASAVITPGASAGASHSSASGVAGPAGATLSSVVVDMKRSL